MRIQRKILQTVIVFLLTANHLQAMEGAMNNIFDIIGFDDDEYMNLLEKLIGHTKELQNNPNSKLIPKEKLVADEVMNFLGTDLPGLSYTVHSYDELGQRPNLIIRYKHREANTEGRTISFMGSHMDVVPADPNQWDHDPFKLTREKLNNDYKLHGRGTTDCLGHVALLSVMIKRLAQKQIKLKHEIVLVFIADEEDGNANVGVFRLHGDGLLEDFKSGPIYWVDTATLDGLFGPRVGTAGIGRWRIVIKGKSGHSGYPDLCINPISVSASLLNFINKKFKAQFQGIDDQRYAKALYYPSCSTFKPTAISSGGLGPTIIPAEAEFSGDVRFTANIKAEQIKRALPAYVEEFKNGIKDGNIKAHKVDGGDFFTHDDESNKKYVEITFSWEKEEFSKPFVANLDGIAYKFILQAMKDVRGKAEPFSALGSLPLLLELQQEGYSLVPIGFGRQKAYHAPKEYCWLSEMRDGYKVMLHAIALFEQR
jgi:acetylornithine deacetylase